MSLTYTPEAALGSPLPTFELPAVDGKRLSSHDLKGQKAVVVLFICNHCPYVKAVEDRIIALARKFTPKEVAFVAICSNDPSDYPEDQPAELKKRWQEKNYGFPYLIDDSQDVARAFGAICTPDIFVYDKDQRLAYRGRVDDSWRNPALVKRRELEEALDDLPSGRSVKVTQNPSMGCSIKWKKGD
jgi:peroxiredoxin